MCIYGALLMHWEGGGGNYGAAMLVDSTLCVDRGVSMQLASLGVYRHCSTSPSVLCARATRHAAIMTSLVYCTLGPVVGGRDPFFRRSWVRFRVPPWVSNTIARDHLA